MTSSMHALCASTVASQYMLSCGEQYVQQMGVDVQMASSVHEDIQLKIELTAFSPG